MLAGMFKRAVDHLMLKKRWKVSPADMGLREGLSRQLNILPVTAQLLVNRGLVEVDKAFSFLKPDLSSLHDPMLMKGMEAAVARVVKAMAGGEKIAVYGDYDVDGTTSAALLYLFFKESGVDVQTYIPARLTEGYGLNAEALKKIAASGCTLVITVDCGSSNVAEVAFANSLGMDVIITDHHEMKEAPPAHAVLNPKQEGCAFPFKGLAGVGVAFNLVVALRTRLREAGWFKEGVPNLKRYLDLVAVGTVADLVPLMDENRVFVHYGLKELERAERPGLKALIEVAGIKGRLDSTGIAFQIAPRINAAGRVASAGTALRLLTTSDPQEAASLAAELDRENTSRQRIEAETLSEALSMLEGHTGNGIVLFSEGWHPGVVGIVASRLVDRFSKPAVLIAMDNGVGKGSARGIRSFDILKGLESCSAFLERFGGHKAAAGLTVTSEKVEAFRDEFVRYADRTLRDEDLVPEVTLDAVVSLDEVDRRLISEIESLAPFGQSNREPVLCLSDAHIVATEVVGSRHLRFTVKHNGRSGRGIGFGLAGLHPVQGKGYGIAFSPYIDEWQGASSLRLRIKDVMHGFVKTLT
ncbi:MAG TPA: single-stranded-DNA-specific exonuclease RecJ [Deltaproteobacteria bacterium]|nr:single-stranded-DNA-specific exonuclease RecJ [Deltaproteobacteria bacterium]HCY11037.1 single-stranded-DNA-specific exonuclease RecJ [Deltaproteobacteria bacterium]